MGIYSQLIFPRLCDLALNRPFIAKLRRELLAHAHGDILEIGFGTGLNVSCYPAHVRKITTVDPNPGMHELARRRIRRSRISVEHHVLRSELLPFPDATFDGVVSTFTLCSIENLHQAMARNAKGHSLFLEKDYHTGPTHQKPPGCHVHGFAGAWLDSAASRPQQHRQRLAVQT